MTVRRLNNHPSNSTGKLRHESGNVPQRIRESIYGFRHGHGQHTHGVVVINPSSGSHHVAVGKAEPGPVS